MLSIYEAGASEQYIVYTFFAMATGEKGWRAYTRRGRKKGHMKRAPSATLKRTILDQIRGTIPFSHDDRCRNFDPFRIRGFEEVSK